MQVFKQRKDYDCMLACIATLLQKPITELWDGNFRQSIEDAKGTFGDVIDQAFSRAGLSRNTDYWCVPIIDCRVYTLRALLQGRRAILQVRSLNNQGAGHFVYWAGETLYDVSNKQEYRWLDQCFPEYAWIFNEALMPLKMVQ